MQKLGNQQRREREKTRHTLSRRGGTCVALFLLPAITSRGNDEERLRNCAVHAPSSHKWGSLVDDFYCFALMVYHVCVCMAEHNTISLSPLGGVSLSPSLSLKARGCSNMEG